MKMLKTSLIALTSISLLLGACGTSEQAINTQSTTTTSTEKTETKSPEVAKTEATDQPKEVAKTAKDGGQGAGGHHKGQVVQSGKYHFELSPDLHEGAIHLDTTIHGESDKAITNAKLVAQVQSPDGTSKTLPITYNTEEKQYTATLPVSKTSGDYKVAIQAEIDGEKINTRFSFKK
jgi:hypothetical protein